MATQRQLANRHQRAAPPLLADGAASRAPELLTALVRTVVLTVLVVLVIEVVLPALLAWAGAPFH